MLALRVAAYSSSKPALGGAQRASASGRSRAPALPPVRFTGSLERPAHAPGYSKAVTRRTGPDGALQSREATRRKGRKPKTNIHDARTHGGQGKGGERCGRHRPGQPAPHRQRGVPRSEEHTSELQSPCNL